MNKAANKKFDLSIPYEFTCQHCIEKEMVPDCELDNFEVEEIYPLKLSLRDIYESDSLEIGGDCWVWNATPFTKQCPACGAMNQISLGFYFGISMEGAATSERIIEFELSKRPPPNFVPDESIIKAWLDIPNHYDGDVKTYLKESKLPWMKQRKGILNENRKGD